jgi:CDP-glucose 4,6-dehydratase
LKISLERREEVCAMFDEFFDGRRVLVTGVAGVKGVWLALELLEAGATVIGVDAVSPEPESNYTAAGLGGRIQYVQGDIADLAKIEELAGKVDCVFHLAAVALVGEARANPLAAYRSNTWGTAVVLEAVRRSPSVRYAVFVTTDKVYRPNNGDPWRESDPLGASGPYAVSKSSSEHIIADYYRMYLRPAGKRLGIGRGGNVLIGGDLHSTRRNPGSGRIFVDCYDALIEGKSPEIFQPAYTRPYTYGLDIISGYMTLMSRLESDGVDGEAFNFGPHEPYGVSNGLLATKICEL